MNLSLTFIRNRMQALREIQHKRGLGNNPNDGNDAQFDDKGKRIKQFPDDSDDEGSDPYEENDDVGVTAAEKRQAVKVRLIVWDSWTCSLKRV